MGFSDNPPVVAFEETFTIGEEAKRFLSNPFM